MSNSKYSIHPADTLKSLNEVSIVDPRNKHIELADWHAAIEELTLIGAVPAEVKQLFENAKNIALYTYFSYRLHQSAQIIGYCALEKALKMKYEQEKSRIAVECAPKRLIDYMNIALEQRWITNQGYVSIRYLAEARVQQKKIFELIESGELDNGEAVSVPGPEEQEVLAEMDNMNLAASRLHGGRQIRNLLMHGESGLSPCSIETLRKIAEEINQLFDS